MTVKVFLFALLSVALAHLENASDEDTIRILTDEGSKKVSLTTSIIDGAPAQFEKLIADRLESVLWESVVQKECVNKTVTEAVFKGMQKNKQANDFQCISKAARETFEKLDAIETQIPENSDEIKKKGLIKVLTLRFIMNGFQKYVLDLYQTKSEEMKKAGTDDARKKILGEVIQKMSFLETLLEQINSQINKAKFEFFENYVDYVFATENSLRKVQREGSKKILKCVA